MSIRRGCTVYSNSEEARADCWGMAQLPFVRDKGWDDPGMLWYAWQLWGQPHGLPMAQVIQNIHPQRKQGKLVFIAGAQFQLAIAQRSGELGSLTAESGEDWVAVTMTRVRGGAEVSRYTCRLDVAWAIRAGHLPQPGQVRKNRQGREYQTPWDTHTHDMLLNRAKSRCAQFCFGDVVGGLYSPEEMSHLNQDQYAPVSTQVIEVATAPLEIEDLEDEVESEQVTQPGWLGRDQLLTKEEWNKITEPLTPEQLEAVAHLPFRANQLACLFDGSGAAYPAEAPLEERGVDMRLIGLPEGAYILNGFNAMGPEAFKGPVTQTALGEYLADPGWLNAERVLDSLLNETCHIPSEDKQGVHLGSRRD